jgi:5'-nucleotidase
MNSRRKFLQQGGLAATAILLSGGAKSFAGSSFFFGSDDNNLVILHSHLPAAKNNFISTSPAYIKDIITTEKRKYNNLLLVDDTSAIDKPYNLVIKGNIRTGIINSSYRSGMSMDEINQLARTLKEEKRCTIVICVSELGFKNKNSVDDASLAASSEYIDIIIGNTATPQHLPSIVLNKKQQEVLINHCSQDAVAVGRISIRFDKNGAKHGMTFSNMVYRDHKEEWKNFSLS